MQAITVTGSATASLRQAQILRSALAPRSAVANLKRILWHLLGGTRGGPLRIRIITLLRDRPYNTNQVATLLSIDYKTAQHHLRVLTENRIASPTGSDYGAVYLLTRDMEESLPEFDLIVKKLAPREPSPPTPREERKEGMV